MKISQPNEQIFKPEAQPEERPAILKEALHHLESAGGFDIVSTTVDDAENMDPSEELMKEIFLTESENKEKRRKLKNRLQSWIDLLRETENVGEAVEKSEAKSMATRELLQTNVKKPG